MGHVWLQDGTILSWKYNVEGAFSEEVTYRRGHTGSILSLVVVDKLFSGSADQTIRVC